MSLVARGRLRVRRAALLCAAALACAPALREPPPVSVLAPGAQDGRSADELVRAADAAWARRADPAAAEQAQKLYLDAVAADEHRVDGLLGAMRALAFRIERERDGATRATLAEREVQLGQWCERRAAAARKEEPACPYRLAIALGQQARERRSTGQDAMGKMVALLKRAAAAAPELDSAGPHRVLALVLLRAPAWPVGPGDPEAALEHAREAARRFPEAADNQLVLAEALEKNGAGGEARTAYERALRLADAAAKAGDPEAEKQREQAREALRKGGG